MAKSEAKATVHRRGNGWLGQASDIITARKDELDDTDRAMFETIDDKEMRRVTATDLQAIHTMIVKLNAAPELAKRLKAMNSATE